MNQKRQSGCKSKRRIRIKKPPILFARSQRLIGRLEKALGDVVLTYWMSPSGSVCDSDVLALYEHCRSLSAQRIRVDSEGITSFGALGSISLPWSDLQSAGLRGQRQEAVDLVLHVLHGLHDGRTLHSRLERHRQLLFL